MPTISYEPLDPIPEPRRRRPRKPVRVFLHKLHPLGWVVPIIEEAPRIYPPQHKRIASTGFALLAMIFLAGIVANFWGQQ